jgi:hypothetical protein
MLLKQLYITVISCGLVACSSQIGAPSDGKSLGDSVRTDCIFRSSIRGYTVLDESNLVIEGSGRRKYHMALRRPAFDLRSSSGISFDSSSGRVCAGFSQVIFDGGIGSTESIRIASIRELSPEDHKFLLIQFGKKKPEFEQTPAPRDVKGAEVEELDTAAADDSSGN